MKIPVRRIHLEERFAETQLVRGNANDGPPGFPDPNMWDGLLIKPWVRVGIFPDRLQPVAIPIIWLVQPVEEIADGREVCWPGTTAHLDGQEFSPCDLPITFLFGPGTPT